MNWLTRLSDRLIVFFVWLLIFTLATGFYFLYLPLLYLKNQPMFYFTVVLFTIIFLLLIVSYWRATCTDPGSPSSQKTEEYQRQGKLQQIIDKTSQRQSRRKIRRKNQRLGQINQQQLMEQIQWMQTDEYCSKCQIVRPARCHHCKHCQKCILRMDHHCPWTGNCVGLYNHKYFILFLLYATAGLAIISFNVLIDWAIGRKVTGAISQEQIWKFYAIIAVGIASLLLAISIGFLLFTQFLSTAINLTTLQTFTQGIEDHSPFDKDSITENFRDICGVKGCSLLPTAPVFRFQGQSSGLQQL